MRCWPEPTAAEIVWCHFPDNIHPKTKPRPALIISTKEDDEGMIFVSMTYGAPAKRQNVFTAGNSGFQKASIRLPIPTLA